MPQSRIHAVFMFLIRTFAPLVLKESTYGVRGFFCPATFQQHVVDDVLITFKSYPAHAVVSAMLCYAGFPNNILVQRMLYSFIVSLIGLYRLLNDFYTDDV